MSQRLVPRSILMAMIAGALGLPIAIAVLWGVSALLSAMDDLGGATVLRYLALAAGLLWAIDLIGLVLLQAVHALADRDDPTKL
ncbi:MAG: hypothetical protein A2V70_19340 [Planctomycetes bacterium RBG_13_63_9]|nr:MAG: hypothetical protein A2V70_19340 [Planctomycetes bacterium RBG_13_63_9]